MARLIQKLDALSNPATLVLAAMNATLKIDYLLQHLASLLGKQSDQVLQEQFGIGVSQFRILRTLEAEPQTTQRDIARNLGQTEASISRQVKLMLADGLLQSLRSPKDSRRHLTMVTPKGLRLTAAALRVLDRFHQPTFAVLNNRQQEQLIELLQQLHGHVCTRVHPDPPDLS